jgi:hypothetical protein
MIQSLGKVFASTMMLIFVMIIPYFIGLNLTSKNIRIQPEVTKEAAVSGEVLGISDLREDNTYATISIPLQNTIYIFAALGFVSIIFVLLKRNYKKQKWH